VKQCKIAVNSVINCSFLYYICCFSKQFQAKNKKNTETGHVTSSSKSSFDSPQAITYLLAIRWNEASYLQPFSRYWPLSGSRDVIGHVIIQFPGSHSYKCSIVTKSQSPTVSEILASKCIGVMTLTF